MTPSRAELGQPPVAELLSLDRIGDVVGAQGEALDQKLRLALTEALAQPLTFYQLADGKVIAADAKFGHVCLILTRTMPVTRADPLGGGRGRKIESCRAYGPNRAERSRRSGCTHATGNSFGFPSAPPGGTVDRSADDEQAESREQGTRMQ